MPTLTAILGLLAMAGPDDFTLVMPVRPDTPEGQRRLAERAVQICGARYPVMERYRFSGSEPLQGAGERRYEVRQEMTCSDAPRPAPTGEAAPADWQASDEDVREVAALTRRFFAAIDSGDIDMAHRLWSDDQQTETPLDERRRSIEAFRVQAGRPGAAPTTRLTWYVNPAGAPRPGIYVAVDYERFYANLTMNCGYLIWYREGDGRYRLTRQEDSVMARNAGTPPPEVLAQMRQSSRCPS